jgi:hypothetical protein
MPTFFTRVRGFYAPELRHAQLRHCGRRREAVITRSYISRLERRILNPTAIQIGDSKLDLGRRLVIIFIFVMRAEGS